MDWAKAIIEAGYKEVLKAQHPDQFPPRQRNAQDEICKKLAVARDRLLALVNPQPAWPKDNPHWVPVAPVGSVSPDPLQNIDKMIDELAGAFGFGLKRTIRQAIRPRRRKS